MSELELREFASRAEDLVVLPDFADLDRQGRGLRRRRQAVVAALAACVLAIVGLVVVSHDSPRNVAPIRPPDDSGGVRAYPGNMMRDLESGTYELDISDAAGVPNVRFTLPDGWNAWEGPNRFNGHARGRSNDEALGHLTWYAGVVYLDLAGLATEPCGQTQLVPSTVGAVTQAVAGLPGHRVTRDPHPVRAFGHSATHFRIQPTAALDDCTDDALYLSGRQGVGIQPFTTVLPTCGSSTSTATRSWCSPRTRGTCRRGSAGSRRTCWRRRSSSLPGEDARRPAERARRAVVAAAEPRGQAGKDSPFSDIDRRYAVGRNRSPYFSASSSARATKAASPMGASPSSGAW